MEPANSGDYLAITIGPIYKTMLQARKTREVWISSYLFSFIMEKLVAETQKYAAIILPFPDRRRTNYNGAGIFPDRLIATLQNSVVNVQTAIIDPALTQVSEELSVNSEHLKNYTQIYYVTISTNNLQSFPFKDDRGREITSFIHRLNFLLDNRELQAKYNHSNESFVGGLFAAKTRQKFYSAGFNNRRHNFPSIIEISANEKITANNTIAAMLDKEEEDWSDEEQKLFDTFISKLDKHHKYMAILRADGDNFGKVIGKISDNLDKVKLFSKKLTDFSEAAAKIITNYGGSIIYIGGDDIVCFAPLICGNENIFGLVQKLNRAFHDDFFIEQIFKDEKVSLSYGLSLTYHKYPLQEALQLSYELLFYKSKKHKTKNCISFQLLQHSGQYREILLEFGEQYDLFLKMLGDFTDKDVLLQSLTHKLVEDKVILSKVLENTERLAGYFENHFAIEEKKTGAADFIQAVQANLAAAYNALDKNADEALKQLNTITRMLKFLSKDEVYS